MILSDLKNYVKEHQQVSLRDAALHFDVEPDAMKGMLEFWISKGKIKKYSSESICGGCSCSQKEEQELYLWNDQLGQISIVINPGSCRVAG